MGKIFFYLLVVLDLFWTTLVSHLVVVQCIFFMPFITKSWASHTQCFSAACICGTDEMKVGYGYKYVGELCTFAFSCVGVLYVNGLFRTWYALEVVCSRSFRYAVWCDDTCVACSVR